MNQFLNTASRLLLSLTLLVPVLAQAKSLEGPKKRVAIMKFEDKSNGQHGWRRVGDGMTDMIITALVKTKKFIVVERSELEQITREQHLGQSGAVTAGTAAKLGHLIGASVIVTGSVTEFGMNKKKYKVGNLGSVFSSVGGGGGIERETARVALDLRFVDTTTGEILSSEEANGSKSSTGLDLNLSKLPSLDLGAAGFDSTTIGKATREAVNDAVKKISEQADKTPWYGRIVKASGERIILNTGEEDGRDGGERFVVKRAGEELVDPDTGQSLGSEVETIGEIKLTKVLGKRLSEATSVKGSGFQSGDMIVEK